jgi:hypothetical protein
MVPVAVLSLLLCAAPAREAMAVCEGPVASDEQEAAAILSRWMRTARVEVRDCATAPPSRRLAFEAREGRILVKLLGGAQVREREIPWLERADLPLARTRAERSLAKLAVLVDALLAEDGLEGGPFSQEPKEPEPPPPPVRPAPLPAKKATPKPVAPEPIPAASPPTPRDPLPAPLLPPPEPEKPREPVTVEPPPPAPALLPAATPPSAPWRWAIEATGSYRFRMPSVNAWEVGGGARWGPVLVGATWQPEATWMLSGRPVGVRSLGLFAGARFELFEAAGFYLGAIATVRGELLLVRRKDVVNATTESPWDLGLSAGPIVGRRFGPVGLEVRLEALLMPTAREVDIADLTGNLVASGRLNFFGARATLCFFWDFWPPFQRVIDSGPT